MSLQLIIWIIVAVCALGTLIAALVVNKDKLKRPENKENPAEQNTDNEETDNK